MEMRENRRANEAGLMLGCVVGYFVACGIGLAMGLPLLKAVAASFAVSLVTFLIFEIVLCSHD